MEKIIKRANFHNMFQQISIVFCLLSLGHFIKTFKISIDSSASKFLDFPIPPSVFFIVIPRFKLSFFNLSCFKINNTYSDTDASSDPRSLIHW